MNFTYSNIWDSNILNYESRLTFRSWVLISAAVKCARFFLSRKINEQLWVFDRSWRARKNTKGPWYLIHSANGRRISSTMFCCRSPNSLFALEITNAVYSLCTCTSLVQTLQSRSQVFVPLDQRLGNERLTKTLGTLGTGLQTLILSLPPYEGYNNNRKDQDHMYWFFMTNSSLITMKHAHVHC